MSTGPTIGVFVGGSALPVQGERLDCSVSTPWGEVSAQPYRVTLGACEYLFMARHGDQRNISPAQVNYQANVWLMAQLGVAAVIGTHTVGSIDPALRVGELVLPDQLIDYTWGRASTYDDKRRHIEFSEPYDEPLRRRLVAAGVRLHTGGVYGCTQGSRLETQAEIRRLAQDGCTLVGMTGMPEACLARELELAYASLCVVVNPAAGVGTSTIDMTALQQASAQGAETILAVLASLDVATPAG